MDEQISNQSENRAIFLMAGRGGESLRSRAEYIKNRGRQYNVNAGHYELAWFVERTTRPTS